MAILIESTAMMGAENTSEWLRPPVEWLFGLMSDERWWQVHHLIRKSGHFFGYGTLCLTFLRGWLLTLGRRSSLTRRALHIRATGMALLSTAFIASCDEFHQSFIPDRTGVPSDVLLDTCGGAVMCLVAWLALGWFRSHEADKH